ncbi:MAG: hypothetical protein HQ511_14625 [Rhodospirillales bacterium]|nr:hypothetical protein [Rhodospirillales bacterium]
MVSGINSGGIPPLNVFQSQQAPKDATQPAETTPEALPGSKVSAGNDQVTSANTIPQHLTKLINDDLSSDGAKQAATDVFTALRGLNLSIANADPSTIPDIPPQ